MLKCGCLVPLAEYLIFSSNLLYATFQNFRPLAPNHDEPLGDTKTTHFLYEFLQYNFEKLN